MERSFGIIFTVKCLRFVFLPPLKVQNFRGNSDSAVLQRASTEIEKNSLESGAARSRYIFKQTTFPVKTSRYKLSVRLHLRGLNVSRLLLKKKKEEK